MKKPLIPYGWLRVLIFIFIYIASIFLSSAVIAIVFLLVKFAQDGTFSIAGVKELMGKMLWLMVIINALAAFVSVWFARKIIDKQSFLSLGFTWKGFETHAYTGFFGAIAMLGSGTFILVLFKYLSFTDISFDALPILYGLGMMLLVAFSEEIIFRGYVLNNLMQDMNKWVALIITSFLFAAMHLGNPGINILSFLEIFIAGIMLGVNYIYTKNLWFGFLLHFAWNFLQGPLLGYEVSGINLSSVLHQSLAGPAYLTGGAFGFEGSVLCMVLNLIFIGVLVLKYEKGATSLDDRLTMVSS